MTEGADGIMLAPPEGVPSRFSRRGFYNRRENSTIPTAVECTNVFDDNEQEEEEEEEEQEVAGVFLQKPSTTGTRKMLLTAGRLILPRFSSGFGSVKNNNNISPLEELPIEELAVLEKKYPVAPQEEEEVPAPVPVFLARKIPQNRYQLPQIVTCSECGMARELEPDCQFQCFDCQKLLAEERSREMLRSSELAKELSPLEESCDGSDYEEEDEDEEEEKEGKEEEGDNDQEGQSSRDLETAASREDLEQASAYSKESDKEEGKPKQSQRRLFFGFGRRRSSLSTASSTPASSSPSSSSSPNNSDTTTTTTSDNNNNNNNNSVESTDDSAHDDEGIFLEHPPSSKEPADSERREERPL